MKQVIQNIVYRMNNADVEFLILRRSAKKGGFWSHVSGMRENSETVRECQRRELHEEICVAEADVVALSDRQVYKFTFDYQGEDIEVLSYTVQLKSDVEIVLNDEHDEYQWLTCSEAMNILKYEDDKQAMKQGLGVINQEYKELDMNSIYWKKEAQDFLEASKLLDILRKYGDIFIRGSYELDLMTHGDIDIYLVNKNANKDLSLELLLAIIRSEFFHGHMYYDYSQMKHERVPQGFYLGFKQVYNNHAWKIDLWLLNHMDERSDQFMNRVKNTLTEQSRSTILRLKHKVRELGIPHHSYQIYNAVLFHGVMSVAEFREYLTSN
jgi:dATP pyrophosphohydrolase